MDDICRYCLPCSADRGRLVERRCPSLEKKRSKSEEKAQKRRALRRARTEAELRRYPAVLALYRERWKKLDCWRAPTRRLVQHGELVVRRGSRPASTGTAWYHRGRIVVTAGTDRAYALKVLVHEMAHIGAGGRAGHGRAWQELFLRAAEEVLGRRVPLPQGSLTKYTLGNAIAQAFRVGLADGTIPALWEDSWPKPVESNTAISDETPAV